MCKLVRYVCAAFSARMSVYVRDVISHNVKNRPRSHGLQLVWLVYDSLWLAIWLK